jgi:hypothetical protein
VLVSGEACPHDLIVRWHRPGRRFLNVYGPTEATVTATWTVVDPGRPVTIGVPLPTYSVVVLDPEDPGRVLPRGRIGELGIAGIGLAVGYVHAVIDIDAAVGNRAQLGHSSSLQSGQSIPDGESWHGSPARRCDVDYRLVQPARCGRLRRFAYGVWQLFNMLVLSVPLGLAAVLQFLAYIPLLPVLMEPGETAVGDPEFYLQVLGYVTALFVLGIVTGLVLITTVPRLFHLGLRADRVYPLYGICYWLQRVVSRSTNSRFYTYLFGDSGAILHYLRFLGYRFGLPRVQSGSNFGVEVKHESPYLRSVGSGTMVSDGLSLMNAEFSNTSFRIRHAALGNEASSATTSPSRPAAAPATTACSRPRSWCHSMATSGGTSGSSDHRRSRSPAPCSVTTPSTSWQGARTCGRDCGPRTGTTP